MILRRLRKVGAKGDVTLFTLFPPCTPYAFFIPFVPKRPSFLSCCFGLTFGQVPLSHLSWHSSYHWVHSCFPSVHPGKYPNSPLNRPRPLLQRPFKIILHIVACCKAADNEHEVATMPRHCLAIGVLQGVSVIIVIIIIFINCNWIFTRWQWLFYTYTNMKKKVTRKFKSGGLHERHVVATWKMGNHLSIRL